MPPTLPESFGTLPTNLACSCPRSSEFHRMIPRPSPRRGAAPPLDARHLTDLLNTDRTERQRSSVTLLRCLRAGNFTSMGAYSFQSLI